MPITDRQPLASTHKMEPETHGSLNTLPRQASEIEAADAAELGSYVKLVKAILAEEAAARDSDTVLLLETWCRQDLCRRRKIDGKPGFFIAASNATELLPPALVLAIRKDLNERKLESSDPVDSGA